MGIASQVCQNPQEGEPLHEPFHELESSVVELKLTRDIPSAHIAPLLCGNHSNQFEQLPEEGQRTAPGESAGKKGL